MLESITKDISLRKLVKNCGAFIWCSRCLYLLQHMLHQIKAPQFDTDLGLQKHCLIFL